MRPRTLLVSEAERTADHDRQLLIREHSELGVIINNASQSNAGTSAPTKDRNIEFSHA